MGPSASAGKNERAATMMMTAKVISEKVPVSVRSVPALSGMHFFDASSPGYGDPVPRSGSSGS